jgi:hypothetical protein
MRKCPIALIACLGLSVLLYSTLSAYGAIGIGFGVGVPAALPIDWGASFTFAASEVLAESNLSFLFTFGTYPTDFPELYEGNASLVAKAWSGPIALYAGGGFSLQWRLANTAWRWTPFMNVKTGVQLWILDSLAFFAQVRSLDPLPAVWSFNPEISLGTTISFGKARPAYPRLDGGYLWLIIGLWVLGFLAYYPRI